VIKRARHVLAPVAAALTVVVALTTFASPAQAAPPLPSSMAGVGDSITRGFNACGFYVDCTYRSLSTGPDPAVNSHYLRLLSRNPAILGRSYNDARSGAKMVDLQGQMGAVVNQHAQYVTVLMGANDACTSSESTMTSVSTYQSQFASAMSTLTSGDPGAYVLVASIPDIYRLWQVGHVSSTARFVWSLYGVCQSMLKNSGSTSSTDEARRQRVRQRVIAYNAALATVCATYSHCKYDGGAVFSYPFVLSQVSTWDYFHPNKSGQAVLSSVTWNAGWGW